MALLPIAGDLAPHPVIEQTPPVHLRGVLADIGRYEKLEAAMKTTGILILIAFLLIGSVAIFALLGGQDDDRI